MVTLLFFFRRKQKVVMTNIIHTTKIIEAASITAMIMIVTKSGDGELM
jgi:hypothetical protein